MSKRTRFSAKTRVMSRCDWASDKAKRLAKIQEAMAALKAESSWPRRKSAASRPKNNSSATLKAARSRANRRHLYRTNLIPRRNATHRSGQPHYEVEGRLSPSL